MAFPFSKVVVKECISLRQSIPATFRKNQVVTAVFFNAGRRHRFRMLVTLKTILYHLPIRWEKGSEISEI
jgi:hypothetical protein